MDEFNVVDAHAVNRAMQEAKAQADERRDKTPTSAEAIDKHAERLEIVRDKIVERIPEEHRHPYQKRRGNKA